MKVELVDINSLTVDPKNARSHNEENLNAIATSLKEFGQQKPIVISADNTVVAGNGTLVAAKSLGWTEIAAYRTSLTGAAAAAFALADNRSSELAAWDELALARALEEIQADGNIDVLATGFDEREIDRLIRELNGGSSLDDPGPEDPPEKPVTRPNDMWLLGDDHKILCGDSTNAANIAHVMAGEKAELLSTDPPYCVDYTGMDRPVHDGKPSGKDWSHLYREIDIADLGVFMDAVLASSLPHVVDDSAIYIWHAHVQQPVIAAAFERHGLLLHQIIIWVKPTATFGHSYYRWRHEPCAFGWKRGHKPRHGAQQLESVWEVDWEGKAKVVGNEHPTQKALRLFEIPMEQHTGPKALVLEPFSGSGTQILAAEKLGRRCRALEIQPAFVDVAVKRWQIATGKTAVLDGDGRTFAELAEERARGAEEPAGN